MKKILAIAVAFMYLAITSGVVLEIHYCMNRQVGASVQFAEVASNNTCAVCGMQNASNKCCHNELKFIKLQDVHQLVTADYSLPPVPAVSQEFCLVNTSLYQVVDSIAACNHSPSDDDDGQPSLFILNRFFRI